MHYFEQCLCADKVYSYCTSAIALMNKLQFYPIGSFTLVCDDAKDRSRAKAVAEKLDSGPYFLVQVKTVLIR